MPIAGELIRIVESQEQVATNRLVDNLVEQALLEQLLERSKPPLRSTRGDLHYLLSTPFRYPPLRHGSRFGRRHEPGIFYGSRTISTALAEAAYYRFVFWAGMSIPPPSNGLTTEHTAFAAPYATDSGIRLHQPPFDRYTGELTRKDRYACTQVLGTRMREHGVLAFEYRSARDPGEGINAGLFDSGALAGTRPLWQQAWLCETRSGQVTFFSPAEGTVSHQLGSFQSNGVLPLPAL
jgi:hypothetical protein